MSRLQPLWLALALLTTLPLGPLVRTPVRAADQGRSVVCYPLAGLLVGGLLALAAWLLAGTAAPLGAALVLTLWVGLTGALHLDGLADCADAWLAGHADPARCLRVMKDPAAGPMGVAALVLVLLLKLTALIALWTTAAVAVVAAAVLGRGAAAVLMATTPYRRRAGIASDQSAHLPAGAVIAVAAFAAIAMAAMMPPAAWSCALLAGALLLWAWRRLWLGRIGGYTGDTAGGLIELVETAVLVAAGLAWA